MHFDLVIKGGTFIDGLNSPRRQADLGVRAGRIEAIGSLDVSSADRTIDATGLIVAPGVIDVHTHYDAQIHWDPYCTNSGSHGSTTVVVGNCGFGFAPCHPDHRDRYMHMMERTEQIPYSAMSVGLPWNWETLPEWFDHLRGLPKGVNLAAYVPMNPLLVYVMGIEAAKTRPGTATERAEMRRLLHEAMDAGAVGFAFSWLGPFNNHTDFDGTPMPTDVMAIEEAYNLAQVLRERGEGVIQASTDLPTIRDEREVCAELARISGQTVIHNFVTCVPGHDQHTTVLNWLDECEDEGLQMYSQGVLNRPWTEFNIENYTSWDVLPVFKHFSTATFDEKRQLARDKEFRDRVRNEYVVERQKGGGAALDEFVLVSAKGIQPYAAFEGRIVADMAAELQKSVGDTFFDLLADTDLQADFTHLTRFVTDSRIVGPVLRHPRVIAGASDGGAHVKFVSMGQYSTDLLTWLTRDGLQFTLEEMHNKLSWLPRQVMGFKDRGTLEVGKAADVMIYDLDELGFAYGRYDTVHDLPDGGWRKFTPAFGIRYTIVNGEVTMIDSKPTGALPGALLSGDGSVTKTSVA